MGFDSWQGQEFFSSVHNVQTGSGAPPASCSVCIVGYFPGVKQLKLAMYVCPVLRLRMNGTVPLLPPHALIACTGTTLALSVLV